MQVTMVSQAVEVLAVLEQHYRATSLNTGEIAIDRDADVIAFAAELLRGVTPLGPIPHSSPCDTCYKARAWDERDPYRHEMGE
jgi:hypothetical protein